MRERWALGLLGLWLAAAPALAGNWQLAPGPSSVSFTVTHLVFSQVEGQFTRFSGSVDCPGDELTDATVEVAIEVASVSTGHPDRDRQLLTRDFFLAEEFPRMYFRSTGIERTGPDTYRILGDLTIRGITREIGLQARHTGTRPTSHGLRMDFHATGALNRFDYGLSWNERWLERVLVDETVEISLKIALLRDE